MEKLLLALIATVLATLLYFDISSSLETERNDVRIEVRDPRATPQSLSVAVLSDIHLSEGRAPLAKFYALLEEVKASAPDLIAYVGDFTANPRQIDDMASHRANIAEALRSVDPMPRAVVLGNYESWSDRVTPVTWVTFLENNGVTVLQNEIEILETRKGPVCVRGLGDWYTKKWRYTRFPSECDSLPKITLTHDPAGAFDERVKGLVISGHTHCGQIRLPLIGAPWVPTDAPRAAACGLYKDDQRAVFTSSGIGSSIIPIRLGTQSNWDVIDAVFN